jgi:chemotaxis protein methyltransferase CheR
MLATDVSAPHDAPNHAELVSESIGLRFRDEDLPAVEALLAARMQGHGITEAEPYFRLLASNDAAGRNEREHFTVRFTTGESYFLRDTKQLDVIIERLLPELIERRASTRCLRIWSAGCSTGEEPYTLAMLLSEQTAALAGWKIEIIASDINSRVLDIARRGRYTAWSFRALDEARKRKYFREDGREWVIDDRLRQMVRFEQFDLVAEQIQQHDFGVESVDLILCRNVFIYMIPDAISRVAAKFATALAEGGYLVTGHGELLGHITHGLHPRIFPNAVVMHKHAAKTETPLTRYEAGPGAPALRAPSAVVRLPRERTLPALCQPDKPVEQRPISTIPEATLEHAWRLANRGFIDDAWHACRDAMKRTPFDPWPFYLQAQLEIERGRVTQAKVLLNKAIYLDPALVAAYLELAALLDAEAAIARARQMRLAACRELRRLPLTLAIKPYENSTAGDLLAYLERQLTGPGALLAHASGR